jgi:hypothetical protein
MVRFVDRKPSVGNDREQEFKILEERNNKILKEKGVDYIDILFLNIRRKIILIMQLVAT